jgi:nicotinamide riboside transporter PnuC
MVDFIIWAVAILDIIGVVVNIRQNRWGFFIWIFTNLFLAGINYNIGQYAQSVLFLVYFIFSVWGWFAWKKETSLAPPKWVKNTRPKYLRHAYPRAVHQHRVDTWSRLED